MSNIISFDSNGKLSQPDFSDDNVQLGVSDLACREMENDNFARAYADAELNKAVSLHLLPVKLECELTLNQIMLMMYEIKLEIIRLGAKLNGIQVSIDDKKAIVSMRIPTTTLAVSVVEAINNIACNAS